MSTPNELYTDYPSRRVAELLQKQCPEGVDFPSVKEICDVVPARGLNKSQYLPEGSFPVIDQGQNQVAGYTNDVSRLIELTPAVVFGDHTRAVKWVDTPFVPGADGTKVLIPKDGIEPRFFYHALSAVSLPDRGYNRHWNVLSVTHLPLPHLDVQREIVAILDSFTELDESLRLEKEMRQKQFVYALDQVFDQSKYPSQRLCDLGTFIKGKGITKADFRDEGLPAMHYGQIHTQYGLTADSTISYVDDDLVRKPTLARPGDIVLATTSEDDDAVGKAVAWLGTTDVVVGGDAHVYSHILDPRYVSYFFASSSFDRQKQTKLTGAKVRRISDQGLAQMSIPVPPSDAQAYIADRLQVLDDYMRGVTMEIDLRNKQLEYYREQLLTFPTA